MWQAALVLITATIATEPTCSDVCTERYSFMCPFRSELSTPKYTFADEFVEYETARELEIKADADTQWLALDETTGTINYGQAAVDGSKIPDFSQVGYHSDGARSLPSRDDIPVLATLLPLTPTTDGDGGSFQ